MRFKYTHELILQFPANSIKHYDDLIKLEDSIIAGLGTVGEVDGHDVGLREMNIFVHTDHPSLAFQKIKMLLGTQDFMPELKVAYRDVGKDKFTILYPPNLKDFGIT